ncbi:hypothetical protein [Hugenholtzia roseola]|uniref:hypothetical protein n=1 Tax=Hugenholtzia roseola TaxID=1002 RepID=UPI0003FAA30A|nr:hypothetical protein [Hugenholtzia roseola]
MPSKFYNRSFFYLAFLLIFGISYALPTAVQAQVQIKIKKNRFKQKPFKCADVGRSKIKEQRFSKRQQKLWAESFAKRAEKEKQALLAAPIEVVEPTEVVTASTAKTTPTFTASAPTKSLVAPKTAATLAPKKEPTSPSGSVWYTSEKPVAPTLSPLPFIGDEDELSAADIEILKMAAKYTRYGYTVEINEYLSKQEIEEGKNEPYKRSNRLKSYLIAHLGAVSEDIYINSKVRESGDILRRIEVRIVAL